MLQVVFLCYLGDEFDFGVCEVDGIWCIEEVWVFWIWLYDVGERYFIDQYVIDVGDFCIVWYFECGGGVFLWIEVDYQDFCV